MVPPGVCRVYLASFHSKLNFRPVEFVTIKASKKWVAHTQVPVQSKQTLRWSGFSLCWGTMFVWHEDLLSTLSPIACKACKRVDHLHGYTVIK